MNPALSPEQREYHLSVCKEWPTHMVNSYQSLIPVLNRDSEGRPALKAQLWSHTARQISEAIIAFLSPENDRPQLWDLRWRFSNLFQETLIYYQSSHTPLRNSVPKFFDIFNSIFFDDSLVHCQVRAVERSLSNTHFKGRCVSHGNPKGLGPKQIILIDIVQSSIEQSPSVELSRYLGTLLHEMLHASFNLFACRCSPTCARPHLSPDGVGWTGHGISWQNAAAAISSFIERDSSLRYWIVNIRDARSLVLEIKKTGLFEDYFPYMEGWGFDPQEIWDKAMSR